MNSDSSLVFVYGSLKRGFGNHHFLTGQTFRGEAETEPRYRMYDYGGFPALVEAPLELGYAVRGELWEVDLDCLDLLDWLEDVDAGLYERARTRLPGRSDEVLIYLYARPTDELPEVGSEWTRDRDLGAPSQPPET